MQLEINFPNKIEKEFDISFNVGKRECHASRDNDSTFLYVGDLNFLGKPCMTMARFNSLEFYARKYDYVIPNLHKLSMKEVKAFARNVIRMYSEQRCKWDTEIRHYKFDFNSGEKFILSN